MTVVGLEVVYTVAIHVLKLKLFSPSVSGTHHTPPASCYGQTPQNIDIGFS
jgi:hypothetical protein